MFWYCYPFALGIPGNCVLSMIYLFMIHWTTLSYAETTQHQTVRWLLNTEFERMWKGGLMPWYQTLSYHLLGRTEKNHINPHQPRYKPGTSQIQTGVVLTPRQDTVRTCCTTNWMWTHGHKWCRFRLYHESVKVFFVLMNMPHLHNSLS
jgi:hypothetical protein